MTRTNKTNTEVVVGHIETIVIPEELVSQHVAFTGIPTVIPKIDLITEHFNIGDLNTLRDKINEIIKAL